MLQAQALLLVLAAVGAVAQTSDYSFSYSGTNTAAYRCTSVLSEELPKLTGAPQPDESIEDLAFGWSQGGLANADDNCELANIGGPDAEAYSDWASSFTSWRDNQVTIYQRIYTACSDLDEPQPIPTQSGICSTLVAKITGGSSGGDDDDDDSDGGDNSNDNNDNDNGEVDGDDGNSSSQLTSLGLIGAAAVAGIIAAIVM